MLAPRPALDTQPFLVAQASRAPSVLNDRMVATILAAFFTVHRELGRGFVPGVYQRALALEFLQRGLSFEQEVPLSVFYKGTKVGHYRAPFVVDGRLVLEVRSRARIEVGDEQELAACLRSSTCEAALLVNFGAVATFHHVSR